MIQSGDAQLIWPVPDENLAGLKSDPNVIVGQDQGLVVRYLMMNNQKKPFNDKKVRQAINYAINKEAYVAVVKNGNSEPGTSVIAPQSFSTTRETILIHTTSRRQNHCLQRQAIRTALRHP